jgi:hypothetical protein
MQRDGSPRDPSDDANIVLAEKKVMYNLYTTVRFHRPSRKT